MILRNRFSVSFEGDHVRVESDGDKDLDFSSRLWKEVRDQCVEQRCFRVLGIANTSSPLSTVDAYDHAGLFEELGIDHRYRIAWVELNPEARDTVQFVETVLTNRDLPGRLFETVAEAREWLLGED